MRKILIIDIETTGFLNSGGKVVELGAVELNIDTGAASVVFDKVVKEPDLSVKELDNAWIFKNSNLTPEDVFKAPYLEQVKKEFQELIFNYPLGVTAYNNFFDFSFLESRGFRFPTKLGCPMKALTPVLKIPNKNGGHKWPNVEEAYRNLFNAPDYKEQHRGAADALDEAFIVFECIKNGWLSV